MAAATLSPPAVSGVIREDEVYSRDEFFRRTRMSKHAFASAKKNGLKVTFSGNRCYVAGRDWHEYLRHKPAGSR